MYNLMKLFLTSLMLMTIANCGGGGGSISTSSTTDAFDEDDIGFNPKMDILFVVDPSKSMFEEVEKVRNNINVFIESFISLGYQYRVGVISTSAWSDKAYDADNNLTFLLSGGQPIFGNLHKGECVDRSGSATQLEYLDFLNASTIGFFLTNFSKNFDVYGVQKNTSGCGLVGPPFGTYAEVTNNLFEDSNGYNNTTRQQAWEYINDERPLQSIQTFLENDLLKPVNNRFVRQDAHLAIIIVSDEPDASRDSLTPSLTFIPGAVGNHTAQQYVTFLANYKDNPNTPVNDGEANYSIYSIVDVAFTGNIAEDIAVLSGGNAFDINATQTEYVTNLGQISQAILVLSSFFPIAYKPIPSTIEILIIKENGTVITVPPVTGFTYLPLQQGVTLAAQYLPAVGDSIKINYVPAVLIDGISEQPRLILSNSVIPEDTINGNVLGTVSLKFATAVGGVYSITQGTSVPTNAYAIDSVTGVITVANDTLFDSEIQGKHQIEAVLTLPDATVFTKSFLISISDIPDATPIAANDTYAVSETIAQANNIQIFGNLTFNDTNIDSSEAHIWEQVGSISPATGSPNLTINPNGTFTFNVTDAAALNLNSSQSINFTSTYRIVGTPITEISNTATVTLTVTGFNQTPVLFLDILDQSVTFSGGEVEVPIVVGDITSSGISSGSHANLIDNSNATTLETSSLSFHEVKLDFPGTSLYEVDRFEIVGAGTASLGNAIFQVLSSTGDTITREVVPVTGGATLVLEMNQKVIGGAVRIIRPVGARNTQNHDNLRIGEISVFGIEAQSFTINLLNHFSDPDSDPLIFFATDEYGEGPAPGWLSIQGNNLVGTPPAGANTNVGIIAQDGSGATAFTVFNITRAGAGSGAINGPPIAVLPLDDTKRGGITLKRYGGQGCLNSGCPAESAGGGIAGNRIIHGEIDNFITNPLQGEIIWNSYVASGTGLTNLAAVTYKTSTNIPLALRNLLPPEQLTHFGDNYGIENGWSVTPVFTDSKYPTSASYTYCNGDGSADGPTLASRPGGRIYPCINRTRSYGESYAGYFVPAKTGVFRFRSRRVDDTVRLYMAHTEYNEDITPVFIANYNAGSFSASCGGQMNCMANSLANNIQAGTTSEFVTGGSGPNGVGQGSPTQIFYDGSTQSYKNGYVLLKQGNVYATEIRFGEGGGVVAFEFEYNRKDQSCDPVNNSPSSLCWDGWQALDASVIVPASGGDAHIPQQINAPSDVVSLDVKTLFYDAEQDILDYTARLVNPNGTVFLTGDIGDIGLTLNAQNGLLTGTLDADYLTAPIRPRIVFTATERFTANQSATSSLPIKFNPM